MKVVCHDQPLPCKVEKRFPYQKNITDIYCISLFLFWRRYFFENRGLFFIIIFLKNSRWPIRILNLFIMNSSFLVSLLRKSLGRLFFWWSTRHSTKIAVSSGTLCCAGAVSCVCVYWPQIYVNRRLVGQSDVVTHGQNDTVHHLSSSPKRTAFSRIFKGHSTSFIFDWYFHWMATLMVVNNQSNDSCSKWISVVVVVD